MVEALAAAAALCCDAGTAIALAESRAVAVPVAAIVLGDGPPRPVHVAAPDLPHLLATLPAGARLHASPALRPLLDVSLADAGAALPPHARPSAARVVVGVVDTGIDLAHPAFAGDRIAWLWDQDHDAICDRAALAAGTCPVADLLGHGTAVTAIAAGADPRAPGVAPDATLVLVATSTFDRVAEGVAWIFARAADLGLPTVVNLSLGGHEGPHDGTSALEQLITATVGPGRIVVAAAGNDGARAVHATATDGTRLDLALHPGWLDPGVRVEAWVAAPGDATAGLSLVIGRDATGETRPLATPGGAARTEDIGRARVWLAAAPAPDGRTQLLARIDLRAEPAEGWYARCAGPGRADVWISGGSVLAPPPSFARGGDDAFRLSTPATARGALAVTSHRTRLAWRDARGHAHAVDPPLGARSHFAAAGPTPRPDLTGPKPDLAAPGEVVLAPYPRVALLADPGLRTDPTHGALRGTSAAAPHVTGAVALLLAVDPSLDPDAVRHILAASARRDDFTGTALPDAHWGAGKLDVAAALATAGWRDETPPPQATGCGASSLPPHAGSVLLSWFLWIALRKGPRECKHESGGCARSSSWPAAATWPRSGARAA